MISLYLQPAYTTKFAIKQSPFFKPNNPNQVTPETAPTAALEADKCQRKSMARILETYLSSIAASPLMLTEFDEKLWTAAIDRVTVMLDDTFVFRFKDGTEVEG